MSSRLNKRTVEFPKFDGKEVNWPPWSFKMRVNMQTFGLRNIMLGIEKRPAPYSSPQPLPEGTTHVHLLRYRRLKIMPINSLLSMTRIIMTSTPS